VEAAELSRLRVDEHIVNIVISEAHAYHCPGSTLADLWFSQRCRCAATATQGIYKLECCLPSEVVTVSKRQTLDLTAQGFIPSPS
jgi:hypothetical protein